MSIEAPATRPAEGGASTHRSQPLTAGRLVLMLVVLGTAFVTTFHASFRAISTGLDPSWMYAINVLPESGVKFGDVVFTYGPLGYLIEPHDIGSNLVQAAGFWIVGHVILIVVLAYHFVRRGPFPVLAFTFAYASALSLSFRPDFAPLAVLGALLTVDPMDRRWWRVAAPLAGALAGVLLFAKFSAGVAALWMVAAAGFVLVARGRAALGSAAVHLGAPFLAVVGLAAAAHMGSISNFARWLRGSLEIARGYGPAMTSGELPAALVGLGLAAGAVWAGVVVAAWRVPRMFDAAFVMSGAVGAAFLQSFPRHGGRFFFSFSLLAIGIVVLVARPGRQFLVSGVAVLTLLGVGALAVPASGSAFFHWDPGRYLPATGWNSLTSVVTLGQQRERLRVQSEANLTKARLPAGWEETMRRSGGTVDVLPWNIALVLGNDLPWAPNPVLQTYSAYTPFLDRWSAQHLSAADAPEHLLVEFAEIDGRHPMMAAPATWRSVLGGYRLVEGPDPESGLLLLERADRTSGERTVVIERTNGQAGEWLTVPQTDQPLFARIQLRQRLAGRLTSALWRHPPMMVDVVFDDGESGSYRVVPATLPNGILINPVPRSSAEFASLLREGIAGDVVRFRLAGEGTRLYGHVFEITWERNAP